MTVHPDGRTGKPVRQGEHGLVEDFETIDGVRVALVWESADQHNPQTPQVCHRIPVNECTPVRDLCGASELCQVVEQNECCHQWAARSVTVVHIDTNGWPVVDPAELASTPEIDRRAVCWDHLPAALHWVARRYGEHTSFVRLGDVTGSSAQPPGGVGRWRGCSLDLAAGARGQGVGL